MAQPITRADDPRWVLALRTAESLEGVVLIAEKRERLLRIGTMMGLSMFDASLVIAIVQDQARRGYHPDECPTAAEAQLTMIPLPQTRGWLAGAFKGRQAWWTAGLLAALVAVESLVLWRLLG